MADTANRIDNIADTALDSALHGYAALGAQDDRLRRAYETHSLLFGKHMTWCKSRY